MKHGVRPTRQEKNILRAWGVNWENWLIARHTPSLIEIVHRHSGQIRVIRLTPDREEADSG